MREWRPEWWNSETIAKENMPMMRWGTQEYAQVIRGIDIGAQAILEALWKLAEESPIKTFTIDSRTMTIYVSEVKV